MSFHDPIANVLFDTPPPVERAKCEAEIVNRMRLALEEHDIRSLNSKAGWIDAYILPQLSGMNYLEVARLIESKSRALIPGIKSLRLALETIHCAKELGEILSPAALRRLQDAIKCEVVDGEF